MEEYKLELKQIVDYPRCRIYRQFVQSLILNNNLRVNRNSHLYYYTVLCCYANFRTSYHRVKCVTYPDIRERKNGMLPVSIINKSLDNRMESTIRYNRAAVPTMWI